MTKYVKGPPSEGLSFLRPLMIVSTLCMLYYAPATMADAIVRSRAMFADTIAEYFVEDDHVRLELEIGSNDIGAFRNLLPDHSQRIAYSVRRDYAREYFGISLPRIHGCVSADGRDCIATRSKIRRIVARHVSGR